MPRAATTRKTARSAPKPFAHVPPDARGHFLLHFYAAIQRLVAYTLRLDQLAGEAAAGVFARWPFLAGYQAELQRVVPEQQDERDAARWWEQEIAAWEAGVTAHLPLRALDELGISFRGRLALLIASLPDVDSRLGTLITQLQEPLGYRRPTLETIGQMLAAGWDGGIEAWDVCRPLLACGLLEVTNRDAPRAEWALRVPALLWDVLRGDQVHQPVPWCNLRAPETGPALGDLILSDDLLRRLAQVPALVREGTVTAIVLRGMQGCDRSEVLGAIARELGLGLAELRLTPGRPDGDLTEEQQWRAVGPLCVMARCLPVIAYELGPGETIEPSSLAVAGYAGPVGILLGHEGGLRGALAERAVTLAIPAPDAALRLRHWQRFLPGQPAADLDVFAEHFQLPGGYICQVAGLAVAQAALEGHQGVGLEDVRAACRSLNRQQLDTLAARVESNGSWEQLVVNQTTALKLHELEQRCRHRERLLGQLGPAFGRANRGVRALFSGSSGTGKSLAAGILATALGKDLYRVDLSAVVNKYIGETEKNLNRVLSRAEELDVVLLLDEGDSLLGSRTEVKSANDRYANLETNYLLQRLEGYQGIVMVTTNASQLIDRAFQRRLDVIVPFVPPQAEERRQIWQLHLPAGHGVPGALLEEVALRCALTGGQIRNAAMLAALLALDEGGPVCRKHFEAAIDAEYRKAGALCPLRTNERPGERRGGVAAFIDALRVSSNEFDA